MKTNNNKTNYSDQLSASELCAALAHAHGEPVQIQRQVVKYQEACGHYCSEIYRVTVEYTKGEQREQTHVAHLLVKILHEELSSVSNEYFMYARVLPELNASLAACGSAPVSPHVYYARKTQTETHYLEDLKVRGYKIFTGHVGYNEAEALLLLRRLGEFHAASLIYTEKHPTLVSNLCEFYACADPAQMTLLVQTLDANIAHVSNIIETWAGYETIVPKLRANAGVAFRHKFLSIFDVSDARIKLVTHGDLWINNILLRSDAAGAVEDAVFLDYQTSFLGSPAFDIHNLLMTSVQLPVLQQRYDALIEHYYAAFSGTLRATHYDTPRIPTLATLRAELRRTDYYNYYLLFYAFAQTMLSAELTKGLTFQASSDEARLAQNCADIYCNARVLETYKYMLRQFEAKGLLD